MKMLSRAEEVILLTILKLGDQAYGVSIRQQIFEDSDDLWSFASIYSPLDKLRRKGYVKKIKGTPQPERGGKSKYYYTISSEGKDALLKIHKANKNFWAGISTVTLKKQNNK